MTVGNCLMNFLPEYNFSGVAGGLSRDQVFGFVLHYFYNRSKVFALTVPWLLLYGLTSAPLASPAPIPQQFQPSLMFSAMTGGSVGYFCPDHFLTQDFLIFVSEDQICPAVLYGPHDVPSKRPEFLNEAFHILSMLFLVRRELKAVLSRVTCLHVYKQAEISHQLVIIDNSKHRLWFWNCSKISQHNDLISWWLHTSHTTTRKSFELLTISSSFFITVFSKNWRSQIQFFCEN